MLETLHTLAKTYGCRPSDLLRGGADALQIDMIVANEGFEKENAEARKAARAAGRR